MARDVGSVGGRVGDDPFVSLLSWLLTLDGARTGIAKVISSDTLQDWRAGKYPRQRSTKALAAVDEWARGCYPGVYPPDWAPSGLIGLAGSELARATAPAATLPSDGYQDSAAALPRDADGARERSGRWVRMVPGFGAVTVVAVGVIIAILLFSTQHPASSSTLYARGGGPVAIRDCPNVNCRGINFPTGTRVTMICWQDAKLADLNYSSSRWFNVRYPGGSTGWVHSSEVETQTKVGLC